MIRHATRPTEAISFFSFLSVILCTIGLLMFVLAGITVVSFWGAEQVVVDLPQMQEGRPGFGRIYVECRARSLLVHPSEDAVRAEDLDDPRRWASSPFGQCLTRLSTGKASSLFFLVRPKGLAVFRKALSYAFAAGGGTADAADAGRARFSVGHQMVTMPGPIRVVRRLAEAGP